jgi:histidinol phosphatase-like enzyme
VRYIASVRIALGCMRLSTESTRNDKRALDTFEAALDAGVRIFDTARSYALDERPMCWCRPPLPALLLTFAHRHQIDLRTSLLIGASTTDAAMARALGISFRQT